jgi:butyryl-CoA dehydrogenase
VLSFGDGTHSPAGQPGAVGYLVGQPNSGLRSMFHMMNEARIAVGLTASAIGYAGYLKSLRYARERLQGRPLTARDPSAGQIAIIAHADVRRMLLAQKSYVEGGMALVLYAARLVDDQLSAPDPEQRAGAGLLLDVLTPIVKSWPSQWCVEANSLAIQVHGGYGYTRDYDAELHWRDNRLNAIHEGTHGIQALDLLGRKMTMDGGAGLQALAGAISQSVVRATTLGGQPAVFARQLSARLERLVEVTALLWSGGDVDRALANATVYLEAAGHVVVAWMWLEQLMAVGDRRGDFHAGKRQATRYFFAFELPKVDAQLDLLASLDTTVLETRDAWF